MLASVVIFHGFLSHFTEEKNIFRGTHSNLNTSCFYLVPCVLLSLAFTFLVASKLKKRRRPFSALFVMRRRREKSAGHFVSKERKTNSMRRFFSSVAVAA